MDIWKMSATELARKMRSGELTVRQVVYAYKEQLERQDTVIHAMVTVVTEGLDERIEEVQRGIEQGLYDGKSELAGVPIVIKDNICTKGLRTTCGSRILESFVPAYNAEVIDRIEKAGMIILGKTNLDEFAMGSTTETSYFGKTKNPWNAERVPGGSSGGSCAAVAAGMAPLALGSDTGGSIRQPAAYCGVVGLKPTYGRVSRYGLVAYASSLDQIGAIGRNVTDCAALYSLLEGYDEKDSTSLQKDVPSKVASWDWKHLRLGVPREYLAQITQPQVKAALESLMEQLRRQGACVEECSLELTDYAVPTYYMIACAEASSNLARFDGVKYGYRASVQGSLQELYKRSRTEGFGEEVKRRILLGSFVLSAGFYDAYYQKALKVKTLIAKELEAALEQYDFLLAPVAPTTAPPMGSSLSDPLEMYRSDVFTVAMNLAGLPALSVPVAQDDKGLPIGMQFIGKRMDDEALLALGTAYEAVRGDFPMACERNL